MKKMAAQPRLTFFCELDPDSLKEVFTKSSALKTLKKLGAGVSLGILDLTPERAAMVTLLNKAGIPVTAWLLLPKNAGYWFNLENVEIASDRYARFVSWTKEHGLHWEGIGLDIEPDINLINLLIRKRGLGLLIKKLFNRFQLSDAEDGYVSLIERMRQDGYYVESYQIPFVLDEKRVKSTILKKVLGIVSLPVDAEIPMLYSSMFKSKSPGLLLSYAQESPFIAIGSTGGGVVMEGHGEMASLSPDEFMRDLALASEFSRHIHVFSLEGCIQQGILDRIHQRPEVNQSWKYRKEKSRVDFTRHLLRGLLWIISNLHWIMIVVSVLVLIFIL